MNDAEDLYENAPCGYLTLSTEGYIVRSNKTLARWLAMAPEQLVNKRFSDLLSFTGRLIYETHLAPVLRLQDGFEEISIDLATSGGEVLPVLAYANVHRDANKQASYTRVVLLRGSQRRLYEQQLVEAKTKSVAAEETAMQTLLSERETSALREQFIAVLGHDLRNPLASISAGSRILLRLPQDERSTSVLRMMQTTVDRMAGLIDNIMDFARGRLGGGVSLNRSARRDIEALLVQVVEELRGAEPDRNIETRFSITEPVNCDPSRLGQLASNLLGNALTHGSQERPIVIGASTANEQLKLWVCNSGAPIPDAAMEKLFEPFVRGEMRSSKQGLGLGLYIASQIAIAHGGTLTASSTQEETRFEFQMPLGSDVQSL